MKKLTKKRVAAKSAKAVINAPASAKPVAKLVAKSNAKKRGPKAKSTTTVGANPKSKPRLKSAPKRVTAKAPIAANARVKPSKKTPPKAKQSPQNHRRRSPSKNPPNGTNVIWKFLEMKEARRNQANRDRRDQTWLDRVEKDNYRKIIGFGRFAGPRRRAS